MLKIIIMITLSTPVFTLPPSQRDPKFFFDPFPKGFTISRISNEDNQAQQAPPPTTTVRFVPLISLLAGMFPTFMSRLGQFTGVNKLAFPAPNNRNKAQETSAASVADDNNVSGSAEESAEEEDTADEDYMEKELIECDGHHLGLWPDKTDPQRYYKCEVDPRTSPTTSCIKEMISHDAGKGMKPMERIEVPGVKPCYLLSMLKCANGFKYQHSTRICVPDIVYSHKH